MACYIEIYEGLEAFTQMDLRYICQFDEALSFSPSDYVSPLMELQSDWGEYLSPLNPESRFLQIQYRNTLSSIGGDFLANVIFLSNLGEGDVIVSPRGSNSEIILHDGSKKTMRELSGGWIRWYSNTTTNKIDSIICYDASPDWPETGAGVNYVTKNSQGLCIPMERHVILVHELAHAGQKYSFSMEQPLSDELLDRMEAEVVASENIYRNWMGLEERDSPEVKEENSPGFCP